MRSVDGIKIKQDIEKKEPIELVPVSVEDETLILPSDSFIENIQLEPPIIKNTVKSGKTHFFSPIGLSRIKENKPQKKIRSERKARPSISFTKHKKTFFKTIIALLILLFLGYMLIQAYKAKKEISSLTNDAKWHLNGAMDKIDSGDLPGSIAEADLASTDIKRIKLLTQSWGQDVKYLQVISPNSKIVANEQLLDATYLIVNTLTLVNQKIVTVGGDSKADNVEGRGSDFLFNISESQTNISGLVDAGVNNLQKSKDNLQKARSNLDGETQVQVDNALSTIDKTIKSLQFVGVLTRDDLPWLSGADGVDKNILILLQNNGELRGGSGGSLGSFGVARFSKGTLKSIDFGKNIYKIDRAFEQTGEKVEVPTELQWLRPNGLTWTLKDSGWAVDGGEASKKIMEFYQKETGEKVDGTIMIDASAVISLLAEVGPIEMKSYGKTIDSNNFRSEVEYEVHDAYFDTAVGKAENEPKKILGDMMPIFMNKVFAGLSDKKMAIKLLSSLSKSLKQKDITFYFNKSNFQTRIDQLDYSGSVIPSVGDYIYANNSNIDGAKSSLNVNQSLALSVLIKNDGTLTNNLVLTRKHIGTGVLPDGLNKNFVRLLLPEKSTITNFTPISGNYEKFFNQGTIENNYYISNEAGKSSVNFWMNTKPGEESEVKLSYVPNYKVSMSDNFEYILNLQKQPGANPDQVSLSLSYPDGYRPVNVSNVDQSKRMINLNLTLDKDRTIKIKFKKS